MTPPVNTFTATYTHDWCEHANSAAEPKTAPFRAFNLPVSTCSHLQCAPTCARTYGLHVNVLTASPEPKTGPWLALTPVDTANASRTPERSSHPVNRPAAPFTPCTESPQTSASTASRLDPASMTQQHTEPRHGRRPARRFLAVSSDALYVNEPPRRLEATMNADPANVVELVGAAVALRDEPECIGGSILDSYGRDAVFFQSVRHAADVDQAREQRRAVRVDDRVRTAWERMKRQHRQDLRGDLLALDKAVDRARTAQPAKLTLAKDGPDGFVAELAERQWLVISVQQLERLERVEAELDRAPDLDQFGAAA